MLAGLFGCTSAPGLIEPPVELRPPGPPIAWVAMAPDSVTVQVGDTIRLRIVATNIGPVTRIDWAISDTARATVDAEGLVLARSVGEVAVRAIVYSATGTASGAASVRIR